MRTALSWTSSRITRSGIGAGGRRCRGRWLRKPGDRRGGSRGESHWNDNVLRKSVGVRGVGASALAAESAVPPGGATSHRVET